MDEDSDNEVIVSQGNALAEKPNPPQTRLSKTGKVQELVSTQGPRMPDAIRPLKHVKETGKFWERKDMMATVPKDIKLLRSPSEGIPCRSDGAVSGTGVGSAPSPGM
ncbi:MAG: hypothetical protein Q9212_002445, partial [Teloschistes hypoglaucus]